MTNYLPKFNIKIGKKQLSKTLLKQVTQKQEISSFQTQNMFSLGDKPHLKHRSCVMWSLTVLPSLSPLAVAAVSVESQLSCSAVASVGPTWAAADPDAEVPLQEAVAAVLPEASAGASDSDVVFVHCRAFFYKVLEC